MTNIWKRSLSLFLAFIMVFGMIPVNAFAVEEELVEEVLVEELVEEEIFEEEILEEDAPVVSDDAPRLHFGGERLGERLDGNAHKLLRM